MKARFMRLFAALLALTMVMTAGVFATDTQPSGLVVTDGSCGTLVESQETLASLTLFNNSDKDVSVTVVELGETRQETISKGDSLTVSAPDLYDENGDAYKLALTGEKDGELTEYAIVPGQALEDGVSYTISLVKGVLDYYVSHGQETPRWITCMIYADENGVDPERSVLAGVKGEVKAGDTDISGISILSKADNTAAIRVGGTGTLTVNGADISLYGNGGDDFTGIGSALGAADSGVLNVYETSIFTQGILRCALFAGDTGILNIESTTVECAPGEYQADVSIPSAGMASPPNGLGIWGNCRAMNLVDGATINITDSQITSQDWGALGVDDVTDGHLTVRDTTIRITDQGYGAYAIGKCVDVFENCVFDIEYGVIGFAAAGDGSEMLLSGGSQADSKNYYGFVTHQSFNGQNTKITVTGEGTSLHTALGGIIAKGRGTDIEISDGAVVTADSGVLVRAQINDDTGAGSMDGSEVVNVTIRDTVLAGDIIQGMGKEYESADTADSGMTGGDMAMPVGDMAMPAGDMAMGPGGPGDAGDMAMGPGGPGGPGGMGGSAKTESQMNVTLEGAELTGTMTSAELTLAIDDGNISMDNILDVGVVTETVPTYNSFAKLAVSLTDESQWTLTGPAYLMELTIEEGSTLTAEPGFLPTMTVDGEAVEIAPGTYTGEIVLDITVDENYVPEPEEPSAVEEAPAPEAAEPETEAEPEPEAEPVAAEEPETGKPVVLIVVSVVLIAAVVVCIVVKKKK